VREGYSQDFVDQAKCKELALTQVDAGSKAAFAAAGGGIRAAGFRFRGIPLRGPI
jgi:hypothetical protein